MSVYITDCDCINTHLLYPVLDFIEEDTNTIVPQRSADRGFFRLPRVLYMIDNDINENNESFTLVARVRNIPDDVVCFKRDAYDTHCRGGVGATLITIIDDDCKCKRMLIMYRVKYHTTFQLVHSLDSSKGVRRYQRAMQALTLMGLTLQFMSTQAVLGV